MSNTQYLGTDAGFYYTPAGGTTWRTYPLAVPLREPRPSVRVTQFVSESLDYSKRQVLSVSSTDGTFTGVQEFIGVIRYDDNQTGLMNFLHNAIQFSGADRVNVTRN